MFDVAKGVFGWAARDSQADFIRALLGMLGPKDKFRLMTADMAVHNFAAEPAAVSEKSIEGAMAFLGREYRVLAVFVLIVAALLFIFYRQQGTQLIALSFVVGALCSGTAGFLGMRVATAASVIHVQPQQKA